jgi:hypothetical protein
LKFDFMYMYIDLKILEYGKKPFLIYFFIFYSGPTTPGRGPPPRGPPPRGPPGAPPNASGGKI